MSPRQVAAGVMPHRRPGLPLIGGFEYWPLLLPSSIHHHEGDSKMSMNHFQAQEAAREIVAAAAQNGSLRLLGAGGGRSPDDAAAKDLQYLEALIAGLIKAFRQPDPTRAG